MILNNAMNRFEAFVKKLSKKILNLNSDFDYIKYWEERYEQDGNSGSGSYGESAKYKASIVNGIVEKFSIKKVLEFGCGDGNQLGQYKFDEYLGLDISLKAIRMCENLFKDSINKKFKLIDVQKDLLIERDYEMVICMEVLMHVTNENDFKWTLDQIFKHSKDFVLIQNPISTLNEYKLGSHENYRNLFPYLVKYLGDFSLTEVITHPSVTVDDRIAHRIGKCASDILIFRRKL